MSERSTSSPGERLLALALTTLVVAGSIAGAVTVSTGIASAANSGSVGGGRRKTYHDIPVSGEGIVNFDAEATGDTIVVAVVMLVGSMPVPGIAFNALTATILAITIGLGVAYSVHVVHRFIDEYDEQGDVHESLLTTLSGTGGVTAIVVLPLALRAWARVFG
ncbi:hypothetical protein [Halapricum desulfuricans]|uniref:Putative exporter of the RND superfamily n=1 Tax=Halapricum desulfuricans TaxID=2841257 RepID=A0A897N6I6_9EURY|nr:hypothetical protein [Halapricum desulfuricans]QSG08327.1 putative exporter of the RND superfamily [Halapricum desulfuricans]